MADYTKNKLVELRQLERNRLQDFRKLDFKMGRVNHSAATDDALSRLLLLEQLIEGTVDAFYLESGDT